MVENVEMNGWRQGGPAWVMPRISCGAFNGRQVLMPLPNWPSWSMRSGILAAEDGCVYLHTEGRTGEDAMADAERQTAAGAAAIFNIMEMQSRVVRSIGSRTFQVVVDAYGEGLIRDE